ncbi:MAG: PQQ-binding-like beta-propeller repeat protein [Fastidiosipila sp.]|nr:PQQ-binding-like beta-propeller repeat protein [Fastidiosipila sp.]
MKKLTKILALFVSVLMIYTLSPLQIFAQGSEGMPSEAEISESSEDEPPEDSSAAEGQEQSPDDTEDDSAVMSASKQTEQTETESEPVETKSEPAETETLDIQTQAAETEEDVAALSAEATVKTRFILVGTSKDPSETENPYQIWLDIPFEITEGTDAWEYTQTVLKENKYDYTETEWGNHLQKVTPPAEASGQIELEGGVTNGSSSSWMWSYNDNVDKSAHEYQVQEDDVIRWYFTNDWSQEYAGHPETFYPEAGNDINIVPDAIRPTDLTAWWPAFGGAMDHNSVKELGFAIDGLTGSEVFTMQKQGGWIDSFSDPIQVGEWIYVVFSDTIYKLNADGSVNASAKLNFLIDSTSRLAYADGLVLVPMKYGKVQALTADKLTTVWIADAPDQILLDDSAGVTVPRSQQSLSSLKVANGKVYQGSCTVGWDPRSFGGTFRALSLKDGSTIWEYSSNESGFYWSGAALLNGVLIVGNDRGEVFAFNAEDGSIVDKMTLPAAPAIRTNMIAVGSQVYFISREDGALHRLDVNSDGSLGALKSVKFSDGDSTASPAISDGKVYAAGSGVLSVIDAATMTIEKNYEFEGGAQGTPLVVKDKSGRTFVFFTINKEPGALYGVATDEDDVHTVFTPDESQQNWCMASVSISEDGTLYYSNDSHTFFAIKLSEKQITDDDSTVTIPEEELPATGESSFLTHLISLSFFALAAVTLIFRNRLKKINNK